RRRRPSSSPLRSPPPRSPGPCGSACQDLGDRICSCQPVGSLRDSCKASIRNELGNVVKPGDAEQKVCAQLLGKCPDFEAHPDQCRLLDTAQTKQDCGMANSPATPP
ncbi:MAG TPA: hypothetical protein VEM76_01535, partial [Anaeromyxobacteraceae bacterium]|nr:hypothetical protein [Anaeromyxobacteraceae bacterium]